MYCFCEFSLKDVLEKFLLIYTSGEGSGWDGKI